ncbi:hypothetical protein R6Z07M_018243 [Ovis aries]
MRKREKERGTSKNLKTAWYIGRGRETRSLPGMRGFPFKHLREDPRREPPGSRCALPRGQIPPPRAASGPAARPPVYPRSPPFPTVPRRQDSRLAASAANNAGDLAHGRSGLGLAWTAEAGRAASVTRPRVTRTSGGGAAAGGGAGWAAVEALAVLMRDVVDPNHGLRRDKGAHGPSSAAVVFEGRPAVPGTPARLPCGFSRDLPSLRRLL